MGYKFLILLSSLSFFSTALLNCFSLTQHIQSGTVTGLQVNSETECSAHLFYVLCNGATQCILLKIACISTTLAGFLHRCTTSFTFQPLVEVVSPLTAHGAAESVALPALLTLSSNHCPGLAKKMIKMKTKGKHALYNENGYFLLNKPVGQMLSMLKLLT